MQLYVAKNGQQDGPHSEEEVLRRFRDGELAASDLVWREGLAEWVPFSTLYPPGSLALRTPSVPPVNQAPVNEVTEPAMVYAGFWWRVGASLIDFCILLVGGLIIGFVFGLMCHFAGVRDNELIGNLANGLGIVLGWLYNAAMESSSLQATFGKIALGLKVTKLDGQPISFGRATGRHFAKIISTLILLIGYLMAAFTEKKQCLHDMMAGCVVVRK